MHWRFLSYDRFRSLPLSLWIDQSQVNVRALYQWKWLFTRFTHCSLVWKLKCFKMITSQRLQTLELYVFKDVLGICVLINKCWYNCDNIQTLANIHICGIIEHISYMCGDVVSDVCGGCFWDTCCGLFGHAYTGWFWYNCKCCFRHVCKGCFWLECKGCFYHGCKVCYWRGCKCCIQMRRLFLTCMWRFFRACLRSLLLMCLRRLLFMYVKVVSGMVKRLFLMNAEVVFGCRQRLFLTWVRMVLLICVWRLFYVFTEVVYDVNSELISDMCAKVVCDIWKETST